MTPSPASSRRRRRKVPAKSFGRNCSPVCAALSPGRNELPHPLRAGTARSRRRPAEQPQPAPCVQCKGPAGGLRSGLPPEVAGPAPGGQGPSWRRSPRASPPWRLGSWPTSSCPTTTPPATGCFPRSNRPTAPVARCGTDREPSLRSHSPPAGLSGSHVVVQHL